MSRFENRSPLGWILTAALLVAVAGAVPARAGVSLAVSPCEPPPSVSQATPGPQASDRATEPGAIDTEPVAAAWEQLAYDWFVQRVRRGIGRVRGAFRALGETVGLHREVEQANR